MSILDENLDASTGLVVTGNMKRSWMTTSKWALFFAILGFIYMGISVLSIGAVGSSLAMMRMMGGDNPVFGVFDSIMPYMTVVTLIMVAVMFFVNFFHLRFATQIQRAVNFTDQTAFVNAWQNLRNNFRIYGIMVCVMIAFYGILLLVVIATAAKGGIPGE